MPIYADITSSCREGEGRGGEGEGVVLCYNIYGRRRRPIIMVQSRSSKAIAANVIIQTRPPH